MFLFLKPGGGDTRLEFNLADTMLDRFESLIGTSFDHPLYALPIALLALLALALCCAAPRSIRPCGSCWRRCWLGTLLAPEWAMGGWAVHLRLPAFFCVVLFAATEFALPQPTVRAQLAGAALALMAWNAVAADRDLAAPMTGNFANSAPPWRRCRAASGF